MLFAYGALRLANIDALLFSAALNTDKRQVMIDRFNNNEKEASVMVATYSAGNFGLNLQKDYWTGQQRCLAYPCTNQVAWEDDMGDPREMIEKMSVYSRHPPFGLCEYQFYSVKSLLPVITLSLFTCTLITPALGLSESQSQSQSSLILSSPYL